MKPKSSKEIEIMREGGKELARILDLLEQKVEAGITPKELAAIAATEVKSAGLQAILLGYQGFPDVICISVNEAIVHGLPSKTPIKQGDVVKLDLTLAHKGLVVDSARSLYVGKDMPADYKRLLDGTKKSLDIGINTIKGEGTRVGDISSAIQKVLDKHKLGIIRDLVGHGVGYDIHEDPNVPNYGVAGTGPSLLAGVTLAIEPMASLGDWKINVLKDGWTIVMRDGSQSALFEHTVLITDKGAEILTMR